MDARHTPEMYIAHYVRQHKISVTDLGVTPVVVVSWMRWIVQAFAEATDGERSPHWMYGDRNPLIVGTIDGQRVACGHLPVGAPGTVMIMEEMIACGARVFLGLGYAGSLQPSAPIGALLMPTGCVSQEGTSRHYLPEGTALAPSPRLVALLRQACADEGLPVQEGLQWTTDAPYRELISTIETYRRQGVLGVDMETSAMYALGSVRGVEVCNLLGVSDELWHEWRPAFGTPELIEAARGALRVLLRALRRMRPP